jgi:predicted transport protein
LIAEDITSRFLNVISLFNGTIPLIAIQMQAIRVAGKLTLIFTCVMDEMSRGLVDEDEDAESFPADRAYWEGNASKATLVTADAILEIAKQFDSTLELKYDKHYISFGRGGAPFNFVSFRSKKSTITLEIRLPRTDDIDAKIEHAGLDALEYNARWGVYRLRLAAADVKGKAKVLRELLGLAYERRAA